MKFKWDGCYSILLPLTLDSAEVAILTEEECLILDAVDSDADQYAMYSAPGKLAWGVGLKVGDTVLARLPPKGGRGSSGGGGEQQDLYTACHHQVV